MRRGLASQHLCTAANAPKATQRPQGLIHESCHDGCKGLSSLHNALRATSGCDTSLMPCCCLYFFFCIYVPATTCNMITTCLGGRRYCRAAWHGVSMRMKADCDACISTCLQTNWPLDNDHTGRKAANQEAAASKSALVAPRERRRSTSCRAICSQSGVGRKRSPWRPDASVARSPSLIFGID